MEIYRETMIRSISLSISNYLHSDHSTRLLPTPQIQGGNLVDKVVKWPIMIKISQIGQSHFGSVSSPLHPFPTFSTQEQLNCDVKRPWPAIVMPTDSKQCLAAELPWTARWAWLIGWFRRGVFWTYQILINDQWVGLRENLNRKPWFLPSNLMGFPVKLFPSSNSMINDQWMAGAPSHEFDSCRSSKLSKNRGKRALEYTKNMWKSVKIVEAEAPREILFP